MGFRRPKAAVHEAMRWREFVVAERDLFARAGLPGSVEEHQQFLYFLEHGYIDDHTGWTVDDLDPDQRQAVRFLVLAYAERFEPGGADNYLASLGLA